MVTDLSSGLYVALKAVFVHVAAAAVAAAAADEVPVCCCSVPPPAVASPPDAPAPVSVRAMLPTTLKVTPKASSFGLLKRKKRAPESIPPLRGFAFQTTPAAQSFSLT